MNPQISGFRPGFLWFQAQRFCGFSSCLNRDSCCFKIGSGLKRPRQPGMPDEDALRTAARPAPPRLYQARPGQVSKPPGDLIRGCPEAAGKVIHGRVTITRPAHQRRQLPEEKFRARADITARCQRVRDNGPVKQVKWAIRLARLQAAVSRHHAHCDHSRLGLDTRSRRMLLTFRCR